MRREENCWPDVGAPKYFSQTCQRERDRLRGATGTHTSPLCRPICSWTLGASLSHSQTEQWHFFTSTQGCWSRKRCFFVMLTRKAYDCLLCICVWGAHTGRQVAALPLPSLTQLVTSDHGCQLPPRFLGRTTRRPHPRISGPRLIQILDPFSCFNLSISMVLI